MKNFIFFIFHQIGSKYLHFEKFPVNFGFLAPSPLFLGFSKFGCFTKMAQNTLLLRYLRLHFGFWPLAPNFLGYHLKNVKFPILTKKTKVFRYLGFIFFGFSPQTPNYLGFHLKIFKFPILTRKPWQYSNIYILNSLLHPILYPKCVPHLGYKVFVPHLEYIYFTKNEVE